MYDQPLFVDVLKVLGILLEVLHAALEGGTLKLLKDRGVLVASGHTITLSVVLLVCEGKVQSFGRLAMEQCVGVLHEVLECDHLQQVTELFWAVKHELLLRDLVPKAIVLLLQVF